METPDERLHTIGRDTGLDEHDNPVPAFLTWNLCTISVATREKTIISEIKSDGSVFIFYIKMNDIEPSFLIRYILLSFTL